MLADSVADSLWIGLRISGPGLHARTASIRGCEGSARWADVACGLRPADAMAPRNHAKALEDSTAALMELVSALERATDTANPRSLSQLLGSLERLKAIAWGRLLATAAPPERTPAEPLDDLRHLTPVQVAELLNLKEAYVHELCRSRQLPATKQGKYWIIPVTDLREWLGRPRRGIDPGRSGSLRLPDRPGVSAPSTGSRDLKPEAGGDTDGRHRDPGARRFQHRSTEAYGIEDMSGYDTNLAAEFYVLSCLHRRGLTANLTLGNKKGVDVVVVREAGDAVTVRGEGCGKEVRLASQQPRDEEAGPSLRRSRQL